MRRDWWEQIPHSDPFAVALWEARNALVEGKLDLAVQQFASINGQKASSVLPSDLNDQAVALLERGIRHNRIFDLMQARRLLEFGLQKVKADSPLQDTAALQFNLALCLEYLQLRNAASKSWKLLIEGSVDNGWSREARERLAKLEATRRSEHWAVELQRLRAGAEPRKEVTSLFPLESREVAELELLEPWARSAQPEIPEAVHRIAQQLQEIANDWLLAEGIAKAMAAQSTGKGDVARSAQLQYIEAMELYQQRQFQKAEPAFRKAELLFFEIDSPYRLQAALYAAICVYQRDVSAAETELVQLSREILDERYPSLAGRTYWMMGTPRMVQGRMESAVSYFERMKALLTRGDGAAQAASADINLSVIVGSRGEEERAWDYLLRGIEVARTHTAVRRRYSPLFAASILARTQRDLALAHLYLDEAWAEVEKGEHSVYRTEVLAQRARVFTDQGLYADASTAIERAFGELAKIGDPGDQHRLGSFVRLAEAALLTQTEPRRAVERLEKIEKSFRLDGWQTEDLEVLHLLAKAWRASGNLSQAGKFLTESVNRYDRLRRDAVAPETKIRSYEQARAAVDELVDISLETSTDRAKASLLESERTRKAIYLQAAKLSRFHRDASDASLLDQRIAELPAAVGIIRFHVLEQRLLHWKVWQGKVELNEAAVSKSEIVEKVSAFRSSLSSGNRREADRLGAALYDLLIRPSQDLISEGRLLVLIADGALAELPFAALYDTERGKYLIESTELTTLPSVFSADARMFELNSAERPERALVVGAPDLSGTAWSDLPKLSNIEAEVFRVSSFYAEPLRISGKDATRSRFLAGLPNQQVVHFAGHAISTGPGIEDQMLLFASEAGNRVSEVRGHDLLRIDFSGRNIVILAACSGFGGFEASSHNRWGLASSLLVAGADVVIAAQWDVRDVYSRRFMRELHPRLAKGMRPTQAMREVMLKEILRARNQANSTEWSVFSISGY